MTLNNSVCFMITMILKRKQISSSLFCETLTLKMEMASLTKSLFKFKLISKMIMDQHALMTMFYQSLQMALRNGSTSWSTSRLVNFSGRILSAEFSRQNFSRPNFRSIFRVNFEVKLILWYPDSRIFSNDLEGLHFMMVKTQYRRDWKCGMNSFDVQLSKM